MKSVFSAGRIGRSIFLALLLLAGGHLIGAEPARPAGPTPGPFRTGEAKFKASCARCHGESAVGTSQGPPLVHKIYESSHHGDAAFLRAAMNGVRAHHWRFGDMPRVEGVTSEDVEQIVQYVRWLQREAGIK